MKTAQRDINTDKLTIFTISKGILNNNNNKISSTLGCIAKAMNILKYKHNV